MMPRYSPLLLLLHLLITISSAKHQPPPAKPLRSPPLYQHQPPPQRSSPLHQHQPPPPPPPRSPPLHQPRHPQPSPPARPTPLQQHQLNNIIDALIGAGDFSNWISMILSASDMFMLPLSATLFVPSDQSQFPFSVPTSSTTPAVDSSILSYHIVPQRLTFSQLTLFKPSSRLPTLLPSRSIVLTNTSFSNFTLDESHVSHPDLYVTSAIAVHGIDGLLNYTVYSGGGGGFHVAPTLPLPPAPPMFLPHGNVMGCRQGSVAGRLRNGYGDSAFVLSFIPWVVWALKIMVFHPDLKLLLAFA